MNPLSWTNPGDSPQVVQWAYAVHQHWTDNMTGDPLVDLYRSMDRVPQPEETTEADRMRALVEVLAVEIVEHPTDYSDREQR